MWSTTAIFVVVTHTRSGNPNPPLSEDRLPYIIPSHYCLSTPHPRAPIAAIVAIGIVDDSDRSVATSEAVNRHVYDGSSSTIYVEIHDISTNTLPILTPMGIIATTHWRPINLCLWVGSGGSGLGSRGRLALLRQFYNTDHRNFYTV